jgi:MFS family permease
MVKKNIRIKRQSTMALKALVWLLGLIVLALCVFALPAGIISEHAGMYRPLLLGMYIPAIPFFIGMFQTLRLLRNIDQNRAFSTDSYESLKVIKVCAFIIALLYGAALPYIFTLAQRDDAPGVVLIGLMFTFGPLAIAVCASIFQQLLSRALDIKSENELTV